MPTITYELLSKVHNAKETYYGMERAKCSTNQIYSLRSVKSVTRPACQLVTRTCMQNTTHILHTPQTSQYKKRPARTSTACILPEI